jgi:2-phospho-L-lactate transferase/gluconeogenesis factor (CofD/UPF0052 family)
MPAQTSTPTDPARALPGEAERGTKTRINLVLFSGGSGTQSITEALLRHPQISLRILINAYDDGHSTGRLRRFIPGMLGPSDVRKNINRLMPVTERCQQALRSISDHRLPVGISREKALEFVDWCVAGPYDRMPEKLVGDFDTLSVAQSRHLASLLTTFVEYFHSEERAGRTFDFTDCAIGNLLFAGCYLREGRDFNRTIAAFSRFYEVPSDVLLNITEGENLFLVAEKENGAVVLSEAAIVAAQDSAKISELFLLDEDTYWKRVENASEPPDGWSSLFHADHRIPRVNAEAARALRDADVIVYGPGTQHSSLFPSYMTEGVAEAIAANKRADKVFVGNIHRDFDIQMDDANDLARKLLHTMSRSGQIHVNWLDVVSHFFVQRSDDTSLSSASLSKARYVPFDEGHFSFPLETVKVRDWESQEGRHSGGYVVDELHQIIQARIDVELQRVHHMVSIVIPVLNEERTVEEVLRSLIALDFQSLGLTKEIILVDGGSTDRTVELARSAATVRVFQLEGKLGRGAALRTGIEKARGNIVAFFPGDNEYHPNDLYAVVAAVVQSKFRVVLGSRAGKCTNLSERLMQIYENRRLLYLTSKYGGMLLSVLTLLLYNRYVSDVLSSVKAFETHLLRSLDLRSNGIDLETEMVAKLSRKGEYMFELPVDYKPRSRSAGKKITARDGLKAIFALFRYRVS